jgi:hypothetical protein
MDLIKMPFVQPSDTLSLLSPMLSYVYVSICCLIQLTTVDHSLQNLKFLAVQFSV